MHTLPVRIGVLMPSLDPVVEHDFQRFLPAAASFHVARLDQPATARPASDESLTRMCDQAPERARPLADLGAELILFCCTSASFFRGFGWDRELAGRIEAATGVPALTTSSAVAEAFAALGVRRAFMVTPYPRSINEREQAFFNAHGVEIPAFAHRPPHRGPAPDCSRLTVTCASSRRSRSGRSSVPSPTPSGGRIQPSSMIGISVTSSRYQPV